MKVAIIEAGTGHDECLYSQLLFLKTISDIHITLITTQNILSRNIFHEIVNETLIIGENAKPKEILKVWVYLNFRGINIAIFNTAQGGFAKKMLALPYIRKIKFVGILHNIRKLESSFGQKIISSKIKKYFVLNRYLLPLLAERVVQSKNFTDIYTIFYPEHKPLPSVVKPENEIWICIPGQVELKRRDYDLLFDVLEQMNLPAHIKFVLLGKSMHKQGAGIYIQNRIQSAGLQSNFLTWSGFIDNETFYTYLQLSDFLMPLIHPEHYTFEQYRHQVSGTYNLALGFRKTMLMHEVFQSYSDFEKNAIFYNKQNLAELLKSLNKELANFTPSAYHSFQNMANKYIRHILQ